MGFFDSKKIVLIVWLKNTFDNVEVFLFKFTSDLNIRSSIYRPQQSTIANRLLVSNRSQLVNPSQNNFLYLIFLYLSKVVSNVLKQRRLLVYRNHNVCFL